MAVQAQLCPEILGLPMCGLQEWMPIPVPPNFHADFCSTTDLQDSNLFLQQNPNPNMGFHDRGLSVSSSSSSSSDTTFLSMALSQSLDAQLEMQKHELDCFLQFQNERLRSALQWQRKQQLAHLLNSMESKAMCLMRQKESDLVQATRKTMELEACLRKAKMENESWKRLAKENEAMVMDLNSTLEQVKEKLVLVSSRAEDAESLFCGSCDKGESEVKEESKRIACKHCNSRSSCVLFLPCRHLCSCKPCEAFLGFCPVCKSVKDSSMEVFWV